MVGAGNGLSTGGERGMTTMSKRRVELGKRETRTELQEELRVAEGQLVVARADARDWEWKVRAQEGKIRDAELRIEEIKRLRDSAGGRIERLEPRVEGLREQLKGLSSRGKLVSRKQVDGLFLRAMASENPEVQNLGLALRDGLNRKIPSQVLWDGFAGLRKLVGDE